LNFTKSINLALSERGINALRHSARPGLLDSILAETIPMYGRMIHGCSPTGTLSQASQAYDVHGRFIRAVDRGGLNKRLLDELETMPNVKFFFRHKMTGADFRKKKAWFEVTQSGDKQSSDRRAPEIEVEFDLLLGADGAHSAARHHHKSISTVCGANLQYHHREMATSAYHRTTCTSGQQGASCLLRSPVSINPSHVHSSDLKACS
jgi:kynurenine 3-monooxygenase